MTDAPFDEAIRRHEIVERNMQKPVPKVEQFIEVKGNASTIELPNLSGIQRAALRAETGLTAGSVLFAGTGGTISQDNSNFYWDDTNNRLGIGTTSPLSIFHVSGGRSRFFANAEPYALGISRNESSNGYFWLGVNVSTTPDLIFSNSAGTEIVTITNSGNLGVGTSPLSPLHVKTATDLNLRIDTAASKVRILAVNDAGSDNSPLLLTASSFEFQSGKVGIGTSTPYSALTISGVSGSLMMANTATPTTNLTVASGSLFVSGGLLFYKGDQGTVTQLAVR